MKKLPIFFFEFASLRFRKFETLAILWLELKDPSLNYRLCEVGALLKASLKLAQNEAYLYSSSSRKVKSISTYLA